MNLTKDNTMSNLSAPLNIEVGLRNSFSKGDNSPQSFKAVFLCLSFFSWCIFALITFTMVVLFEQPLWLVSPLRDIANPPNASQHCVTVLLFLAKVSPHEKFNSNPKLNPSNF